MHSPQHAAHRERAASRSDRGSWPLPAREPLPWPTPGNEDAINSNPRLYGATRPTRTAGDGYYARAAPPVPHEDDPLAHLFPSPVLSLQLPDSHFAFNDRSHNVDKLYDHRVDNRRKTPNWSFQNARAPVFYEDDVPHDLDLPEDGSTMRPIPWREWQIAGGVLLVILLCSVGGWAAWYFGTGQQNKK
ncbi:hypothetical protein JCM9279_007524 [Rhodotorula babjevae]